MPKLPPAHGSDNQINWAGSVSPAESFLKSTSIPNQNLEINVKDYGAKGDRITDDTGHIQTRHAV